MKKFCLLLLLSFPLLARPIRPPANEGAPSVLRILSDLDRLMERRRKNNATVTVTFEFALKLLRRGALAVVIDPHRPRDFYSGIGFTRRYGAAGRAAIVISPYIPELYERSPSLVYSALIHEFKHAYDYYHQREKFLQATGNEFERYLFEMDANYLEALFIRDVLKKDYRLSGYEKFLLASFEKNNLADFSTAFMFRDMRGAYLLKQISESKLPPEEKLKRITDIGNEMLKFYVAHDGNSNWDAVIRTVPLLTYSKFVPCLALPTGRRPLPLDRHPPVAGLLSVMRDFIKSEQGKLEAFQRELRASYSDPEFSPELPGR